ncbi:MAG: hypothetical protein IKQ71_03470 [Lachnospiraceae bacterium]|nr:hypothetical protein [Lachnospiraceae bacterium]
MKRIFTLFLISAMACGVLSGCSDKSTRTTGKENIVDQLAKEAMSETATDKEQTESPTEAVASSENGDELVISDSGDTSDEEYDKVKGTYDKTAYPEVEANDGTGTPEIDLTQMNSTMVYSEVYNMMSDPTEYRAKTVKMKGTCTMTTDENTGDYFFACLIKDATACCSQGIEFQLVGKKPVPEDYPAENSEITVQGVFDTYFDQGYEYCTLRYARLVE